MRERIAKYGYMTLAGSLNSTLAEMFGESHAGREFLTLAYNNIENDTLVSECEKLSHSKGLIASEKTIKKDLKMLVDDGLIEAHRETVELDGKRYSPVVVYGSLDAFKADIEQARVVLAEGFLDETSTKNHQTLYHSTSEKQLSEAKPTGADPEVDPLPFDQDVADKLVHYCVSRDQWRQDTVGGESAAVTFSSLIDMRSPDGEVALQWLDDNTSRLITCDEVCLGVASDLAALARDIYGDKGSVHLSELTVADTVGHARDLLMLAENDDCLRRGLLLVWLIQDAQAIYETKVKVGLS